MCNQETRGTPKVKNRSYIIKTSLILLLFSGFCWADDAIYKDRFEAFRKHDNHDPMFSNQAVIDVVRDAMLSNDDYSIDQVIFGLRNLATKIHFGAWLQTDILRVKREIPNRSFIQIPAFKNYLINYWEQKYKQFGEIPNIKSLIPTGTTVDTEELLSFLDRHPWIYVPDILATFYPEDRDVYDLIWKVHQSDDLARTMTLLNKGKFSTERATKIRIDTMRQGLILAASSSADARAQALSDAKIAVLALGRFRSPRGLQALNDNLHRIEFYPTIVTAIAAYGKDAEPYLESLKSMKEHELAKRNIGPYQGITQSIDFLQFLIDPLNYCCAEENLLPVHVYKKFEEKEVFNEHFPNRLVHRLIQTALVDPRPEVLDNTLRGIGELTSRVEHSHRNEITPVPPMRRLADIPGFKEFLLEHWSNRLDDSQNSTVVDKGSTYDSVQRPGWQYIPEILSTHYPRDAEIHRFLWEVIDASETFRLIRLLNNSQDRSYKASQLRISQLKSNQLDVIKEAALGLGWFQPEGGLEALAEELGRRDTALPVIIKSLVAYGQDAEPYLGHLKQISLDRTFSSMSVESREESLNSMATLVYMIKNPSKFSLQN